LAILAFIGGGLAISWLSSSGLMPWSPAPQVQNEVEAGLSDPAPPIANPMTAAPLVPQIIQPIADSRRTEAMLTVMAARRAIASGAPLGDVAARLQASFGTTQPQALSKILAADRERLTPAVLLSDFDAIAPQLAREPAMTWDGLQRELASLFVLRRTGSPPETVGGQLQQIRDYLAGGNVEAAMRFVETLPGASNGRAWKAKARRYLETQRALDQLEAAAIALPVAPVAPLVVPQPLVPAPATGKDTTQP